MTKYIRDFGIIIIEMFNWQYLNQFSCFRNKKEHTVENFVSFKN